MISGDDLGWGHISVSGALVAAMTWVWRKLSAVTGDMNKLELKVAENYVTRPEMKVLEDKLDRHYEVVNSKIDTVNTSILTLSNLLVKRE